MGLAPSLSSSKVWDRDGRGKDLDKIPKRDRIGGRDEREGMVYGYNGRARFEF